MTGIERRSVEKLKSKDFCDKGMEDDRGSRLCKDNVSCRDEECVKCLEGKMKLLKLLIDSGHGGKDSGAVSKETGIEEEDISLNVVFKLGNILRAEGHNVLYTRDKDTYISPTDRLKMIVSYNPDAFISIHCNSSKNPQAHGIETIYRDDEDYPLAAAIHKSLIANTEFKDRGIKQDGSPEYNRGLAVLKNLKVPSCLVELGFMSNESDLEQMDEENETENIAQAIAEGVNEYAS